MRAIALGLSLGIILAVSAAAAYAGVGDPQTKTDHAWYPGELSCSTFDRLFKTQADLYERVTGKHVASDEDKALASWYWRNLNYFHCTQAKEDWNGKGLDKGEESREYWSGLFGYGFGLCYATHHQYAGEIDRLLGPGRSRAGGVDGHTTFEVWLTGGPYGDGQWALLDHDISTVVFTPDGKRMMGLLEVSKNMASLKASDRSHGFIPGGLHPSDPDVYRTVKWVGYGTGYAAVPPLVNLRAGESLRRYVAPGLDDGKAFAYWGINYNADGIPGPSRDRTWVNQPEKMYKAGRDCGSQGIKGRYANAVYTYKPDFASAKYKEAVVDESDAQVTLEWESPYVIAAAPPPDAVKDQWGIMKSGCTGGLVVSSKVPCPVEVSVDQGKTWQKAGDPKDGALDLTDLVKGSHQYWLRLGAGAKDLAKSGLTIRTVCQCAATIIPHVRPGKNAVTVEASGHAVVSAGPNMAQAAAHVVDGAMGSKTVTLELAAPRKAPAVELYVVAHVASGAPPSDAAYNIEWSADGGKTWKPVLKDWKITRRPPEPDDWWSQSFLQASTPLDNVTGPVRVRYSNTGGRNFLRAEADLVYKVENSSPLKVTYAWKDGEEVQQATRTFNLKPGEADATWSFDAKGASPVTQWVEYTAE